MKGVDYLCYWRKVILHREKILSGIPTLTLYGSKSVNWLYDFYKVLVKSYKYVLNQAQVLFWGQTFEFAWSSHDIVRVQTRDQLDQGSVPRLFVLSLLLTLLRTAIDSATPNPVWVWLAQTGHKWSQDTMCTRGWDLSPNSTFFGS